MNHQLRGFLGIHAHEEHIGEDEILAEFVATHSYPRFKSANKKDSISFLLTEEYYDFVCRVADHTERNSIFGEITAPDPDGAIRKELLQI